MDTSPSKDVLDEPASSRKESLALPLFSADADTGSLRVELDAVEDWPVPSPFCEAWDSNCACT